MIASSFIFLLSVLLNTTLAFFAAAFVVEGVLALLQIKQHRTRSICRMIPFISLIFDRLFSQYSFFNWLNPLSCESCMQKFWLNFFPRLQDHLRINEVSLMSYLDSGNLFFSRILFILFCSITALALVHKILQVYLQNRLLHFMVQNSIPCKRPIDNAQLASELVKYRISIVTSTEALVPMATYNNKIILPTNIMKTISQNEFEAIISHELEHIRWKDPLSRLVAQLVSAAFWWIPTQRWTNKWLQDQEIACDESILTYRIHSDYLASALVKVAKQVKITPYEMICTFVHKNPSLVRLQAMVGLKPATRNAIGLGFVGISFSLLVICGFWL